MKETKIPLCGLYENTSKTTGKRYFVGNLSFTSRLLLFQNEDAKAGEPGWTAFLVEREPKPPAGGGDGITSRDYPTGRRKAQ